MLLQKCRRRLLSGSCFVFFFFWGEDNLHNKRAPLTWFDHGASRRSLLSWSNMIHSGFDAIQGVVPGRHKKRWQTKIDFSTGCVMVKPSNTSIVWMVWMLWQWLDKKKEEKEEPSFWAWRKILWFFQKTIYTNVKHDHFLPSCLGILNFVPWQEMFVLRRRIRERIHPNKIYQISFTLPETNIAPENRPWKRRFLLETTIFRCYVSFGECSFMAIDPFQNPKKNLHFLWTFSWRERAPTVPFPNMYPDNRAAPRGFWPVPARAADVARLAELAKPPAAAPDTTATGSEGAIFVGGKQQALAKKVYRINFWLS